MYCGRQNNKGFLIGLMLFLILALTACGQEEAEPVYGYQPTFLTVPEQVFKGVRDFAAAEEGIYLVPENSSTVKLYDFRTDETDKLFTLSNKESILKVGIGGDSQERLLLLTMLRYGTDESGNIDWNRRGCFLSCYTADGQLQWESAIEEDLSEHTNCKLFMAEDGRAYMSTDTCFYGFSAEGEQLCRLEYQESRQGYLVDDVLACDEAGGIYLIQLTKRAVGIDDQQWTIRQWDEAGNILKEQGKVDGKDPVQLMEGSGLYFNDLASVYRYELQTGEMIPAFSLTENLIDGNAVGSILQTENGWLIGGSNRLNDSSRQIVMLEWGLMTDVESLALAAINTSTFKAQIISFNQQHPEYRLTLHEYTRMNTPDEADPIQLALLGKDAPDLVEIYSMEEYLNYARKGYLLDLTDYVETSDSLSREDYISGIWEAMQIDGRIYSLPEQFSVSTIAVPESAVGNKTNWTIEEFLDLMEEYPNAYYMLRGGEMSLPDQAERKGLLLGVALTRGLEGFVDVDRGRINLDNEQFRSLLTRINNLQIDENAGLSDEDLEKRLEDGEILMRPETLNEITLISRLEREHGEPMTLIGYPTAEREEGGGVFYISSPLGINGKSGHEDAAWCFLEAAALPDNGAGSSNLPANQEKLEKLILEAQKTKSANFDGAFDENGNADSNTLPQRHADMIWNTINSAVPADPVMRQLQRIIQEEASYYFAGEKKLDEVIELMENRAELYFQENR